MPISNQTALNLAARFGDVRFVYPVHLNPNVQQPVRTLLGALPNVHLIDPLDYEPFVYLLKHCHLVLTDSGGIQEEAPSLGKPVLVMRQVTERPEAVQAGTVELVGADRGRIVEGVALERASLNGLRPACVPVVRPRRQQPTARCAPAAPDRQAGRRSHRWTWLSCP